MVSDPQIGFISPPGWSDPSPSEFREICAATVRVQQYSLPLPAFDWRIETIGRTEPDQIRAAESLSAMGCDVIATVGTPFAWAGLDASQDARARCGRLTAVSGVPNVMAGIAILDAFEAMAVRKVGLACTYYADEWRRAWSAYVAASGFEVRAARTLADDGLVAGHGPADEAFWAPSPANIVTSVRNLVRAAPDLEAIAISGAGARTLSFAGDLEAEIGRPVVGSDSALYWAIAKACPVELEPGLPGKLGGLSPG